jgi:adenosylcobyric acid synthase
VARCIMVQGTASGVGKSLIVTALCRYLADEGYTVAPFKAWNMSLNAFVTPDGREIGRAQGIQAEAARIPAQSDFNPILVKPKGDLTSQVILNGQVHGDFTGFATPDFVQLALQTAAGALSRLKANYDWVVIEGAGSPAEPNLRDRDMANMAIADMADAPVLLVADMLRGGSFAALLGTMALLEPHHQARVKGLLLNRYHGPKSILAPGIAEIEARTGKRVLGVLPHLPNLHWEEEDATFDVETVTRTNDLVVAVVRLPHLANTTDLVPLTAEPDVSLRYVDRPEQLAGVDLVLLLGSKNTIADLRWLKQSGLSEAIRAYAEAKGALIGLCGGYQMLGRALIDPDGLEDAPGTEAGLGVLPVTTEFTRAKQTTRTVVEGMSALLGAWTKEQQLEGYEIHHGQTTLEPGSRPAFRVVRRGGQSIINETDGCMTHGGWTFGTYLHGLFDNDLFRRRYLNALRARKALPPLEAGAPTSLRRERTYNLLAEALYAHVDLPSLVKASHSGETNARKSSPMDLQESDASVIL